MQKWWKNSTPSLPCGFRFLQNPNFWDGVFLHKDHDGMYQNNKRIYHWADPFEQVTPGFLDLDMKDATCALNEHSIINVDESFPILASLCPKIRSGVLPRLPKPKFSTRSGNVVGVQAVSLEIMQIVTSTVRAIYQGHCIGECCILASL